MTREEIEQDDTISCWISTRIKGVSASLACEGNISLVLLKKLDKKILPYVNCQHKKYEIYHRHNNAIWSKCTKCGKTKYEVIEKIKDNDYREEIEQEAVKWFPKSQCWHLQHFIEDRYEYKWDAIELSDLPQILATFHLHMMQKQNLSDMMAGDEKDGIYEGLSAEEYVKKHHSIDLIPFSEQVEVDYNQLVESHESYAQNKTKALKARIAELRDMLQESVNQIEYLHGKFKETGSGNSVLSRAKQLLNQEK